MIHWLLAVSDGHFWQPAEFKNVVNPDFENLKHLQNLGFFFLISDSMTPYLIYDILTKMGWGVRKNPPVTMEPMTTKLVP